MPSTTETTNAYWRAAAAAESLAAVRRYVRRANRWHEHVRAHHADPGLPCTKDHNRMMPSKAAKWKAYDEAAYYHRVTNRPGDRPHTFADLAALVGEPNRVTP